VSSSFVEPNYLISYSRPASVNDYRCVVNGDGTQVIFERSLVDTSGEIKSQPNLYVLDLPGPGNEPAPFLKGATLPLYSDRPDWSWQTGAVAFNWIGEQDLEVGAALSDGTYPTRVKRTSRMEYPTWYPDGTSLAVMNIAETASPRPSTTRIDSDGTLTPALAGPTLWAGMPSVNQTNPHLIAFAGQLVHPSAHYDQDKNYVWLLDVSQTLISVAPLEYGCPSSGRFDRAFQARAPWWSPDGKWIVFESTRADTDGKYAIFLYEVGEKNGAVQLTDPVFNMNHAKWFPNGFPGYPDGDPTLIVAAYQPHWGETPQWPWGLATLDVSAFV
jgi:WD40 repeat protein